MAKKRKPTKKKVTRKKITKKVVRKAAKARPARRAVPRKKKGGKLALAIVGLVLNMFVLPGLGSLVAGKTRAGIWQLVLLFFGILLIMSLIGIIVGVPLIIASWIWGIVTGVKAIEAAS